MQLLNVYTHVCVYSVYIYLYTHIRIYIYIRERWSVAYSGFWNRGHINRFLLQAKKVLLWNSLHINVVSLVILLTCNPRKIISTVFHKWSQNRRVRLPYVPSCGYANADGHHHLYMPTSFDPSKGPKKCHEPSQQSPTWQRTLGNIQILWNAIKIFSHISLILVV